MVDQKSRKIVCVGNRLVGIDSPGPMVYDHLVGQTLPDHVQIIDGGLAGLDLMSFIEGAGKVIFVDSASGFRANAEIFVLNLEEIIKTTDCDSFSHANGLIYLLHTIPKLIKKTLLPIIHLVGIQGPPRKSIIRRAAETSLQLATE